jgi:hypothetical protein
MTGAKLCTRGDDRPEHITMIPLVTAFIAAVVAFIAFLQWQTAREKVLLDLFDKRFAVYEELRSVMGRHLGSGIDEPAFYNFVRTVSREVLIRTRSPDLSRRETERPRSRLPAKRPATAGSRRPKCSSPSRAPRPRGPVKRFFQGLRRVGRALYEPPPEGAQAVFG